MRAYANDMKVARRNVERIQRKVDSGRYSSVDHVLDSALELLDERDEPLEHEMAEMFESVRRGTEQADAGQVVPASQVFDELRRRNAAMTEHAI